MPHIRARTLENASHPTRCTLCAFFRLLARPQTRGSARASIVLQRPKPLPGSERLGTGPGPPLSRLQGAHTASEGQPLRSAPAIVPRAGLVRCSRAVRCPVSAARTTARVCCQGVVVAAHTRPQAPDECSRVLYAPVVRLRDLRCTPPTLRSAWPLVTSIFTRESTVTRPKAHPRKPNETAPAVCSGLGDLALACNTL